MAGCLNFKGTCENGDFEMFFLPQMQKKILFFEYRNIVDRYNENNTF